MSIVSIAYSFPKDSRSNTCDDKSYLEEKRKKNESPDPTAYSVDQSVKAVKNHSPEWM